MEHVLTHTDYATNVKTHIVIDVPDGVPSSWIQIIGIEVQELPKDRIVPSKVFSQSDDQTIMQMKARGFKAKAIAERLGVTRQQVYARYYLLVNHKGVKHSGRHVKPTRVNTRISAQAANLVRDFSIATQSSLATSLDSILRSTVVKEYVESHPSVIAYREVNQPKGKDSPAVIKLRGFHQRAQSTEGFDKRMQRHTEATRAEIQTLKELADLGKPDGSRIKGSLKDYGFDSVTGRFYGAVDGDDSTRK